jgi:hypothetical protein
MARGRLLSSSAARRATTPAAPRPRPPVREHATALIAIAAGMRLNDRIADSLATLA